MIWDYTTNPPQLKEPSQEDITSNPKLLQLLQIKMDVEPLLPVGKGAEIPEASELRIKVNDVLFYVATSKGAYSGEFGHVAVVYGWGQPDNPRQYYDTYEDAIKNGISDPVLYVMDRGVSQGQPFRFDDYSKHDKAAEYSQYSFWVATELPPEGVQVVTPKENGNAALYSTPGAEQPSSNLFAFHRAQVKSEAEAGGEVWFELTNGLWVRSSDVNVQVITYPAEPPIS